MLLQIQTLLFSALAHIRVRAVLTVSTFSSVWVCEFLIIGKPSEGEEQLNPMESYA